MMMESGSPLRDRTLFPAERSLSLCLSSFWVEMLIWRMKELTDGAAKICKPSSTLVEFCEVFSWCMF
jgi:hypothetical protein